MAGSTLLDTHDPATSGIVALVAIIGIAPALVLAVFLHELTHALTAVAFGQTVTRVLVGEGVAWWRIGRDPQFVIGSVPLGNGLTTVLDLRRVGYRWRFGVMSMTAPVASATLALAAYALTVEWSIPARTAALLFAFSNAALTVATLIPVATFGGRVWSDLAATLLLARADDRVIEEHMLQSTQERMKILVDAGLLTRAIETARRAVAAVPVPLAYSLLAYALHRNGQHDEAAAVARHALTTELDDANRTYLQTVVDIVQPSAQTPTG